jgi:hypothetical protein
LALQSHRLVVEADDFAGALLLAVIPAIYALVKQWRLARGREG